MAITLQHSTTTLTLHPDLYWSDEHQWHPVEQTTQRTLSGALIVSVAERQSGRPITLEPENEQSAWLDRETLDTLRSWAAVPGRTMTLTLRGVAHDVIFRHQDGAAVEARPIVHYSDVEATDFYSVTLRFMEI